MGLAERRNMGVLQAALGRPRSGSGAQSYLAVFDENLDTSADSFELERLPRG